MSAQTPRLTLSGTYTLDPFVDVIDYWAEFLGLDLSPWVAPYAQLFQQLLDPSSALRRNESGATVVLLRWVDLVAAGPRNGPVTWSDLEPRVAEVTAALTSFVHRVPCLVLVGPSDRPDPVLEQATSALVSGLDGVANLFVEPGERAMARYRVAQVHDPVSDRLGHAPFTPEANAALGTTIIRWYSALVRPAAKVVAVDGDNTLWDGVVGEAGVDGVRIDEAHQAFERALVAQHDRGRLLCLLSKNQESDVRDVFERHPEMPLRWSHLVARRVNWNSKAENLTSIVADLDLALDSVLFLDDSPVECAEMRARCPAVTTVRVPTDPGQLAEFTDHLWLFDQPTVTAEDQRRARMYRETASRSDFRRGTESLEAFLAGLELVVDIVPPSDEDVPRLAQLTQRTNQFNASLIRCDVADVRGGLAAGGVFHRLVRARDRFGDYGIVGQIRGRVTGSRLEVDLFTLSCRALGRGIEHRMVACAGTHAVESGIADVAVLYRRGPRNTPARRFLETVFGAQAPSDEHWLQMPAAAAAAVVFDATAGDPGEAPETSEARSAAGAPSPLSPWNRYEQIAHSLTTADSIVGAMAARVRHRTSLPAGLAAPATAFEVELANIWREVLRIGEIGVDEDFFDLGGNSLRAMQVASRVRRAFAVDLSLDDLLAAPTVARLAARVGELRASATETTGVAPLAGETYRGPADLSFAQQRMWFLDQMGVRGAAYVIPHALRLTGRLDTTALGMALSAVAARQESLRTTFSILAGRPVQVVAEPAPVPMPVVEIGGEAQRLPEMMRREAQADFDLARGPLFRARLYRLNPDEHVLLLLMHHLVSDEWSVGVLMRDLEASYRDCVADRPFVSGTLPVQYRDFARWQRARLQGPALDAQLGYWQAQLGGAPQVLELPGDRPRPGVESHRGAVHAFRVPPDVSRKVAALARREGTTLFMTLLAAFDVLLSRYTRQEDLLVGTPVTHRDRPELEDLVGLFVNTLVLRADLSGDPTVREFLGRVRETCLGAYAHQDLPFERLVEAMQPERDLSRNPLFQVMFVLQDGPHGSMALPDLRVTGIDVDRGASQVDLTLFVRDTPAGLQGTFEYATDLFDEATVTRMAGHWQSILAGMSEAPDCRVSGLPLLTAPERHRIVEEWNATDQAYALDRGLPDLFEAQVRRTPDRVAVETDRDRLTYRELNERADRLSWFLRGAGVGSGSLVGVAMERSLEMVVSLYGILKAGAAYVPLDPTYPADRLAYMMDDARVAVLLTQAHVAPSLPAARGRIVALDAEWEAIERAQPPSAPVTAAGDDLAYVIYTSGSTGQPKGAMNTHRGIVNRLLWMQDEYHLTADDAVLQKTPFSFDVSVWEFFWPLITGARLVMAQPEGHKDPAYLVQTIRGRGITTLHFVPAMLQVFLEEPDVETCTSLRRVICSGEALSAHLRDRFFERLGCELHNLYGPTECAVDVTFHACRRDDGRRSVPIGRPVANTRIYVLDATLQPVPVGVAGELYIGGVQVGRGYHGRPDLTAERFVPDPFSGNGARMYRTGDLARFLPDGSVDYLGRLDFQVKLRGFRIELGEIESVMRQHPAVREAVALVREDRPGDRRLVGYYVAGTDAAAIEPDLRRRLGAALPDHMVPSALVRLDTLPLLSNGKVDRRSLPAPDPGQRPGGSRYVAPGTAAEQALSAIWAEVLGRADVGLDDNFFDLGGNSILLIQVVAQAGRQGFAMTPLTMFRHPTLRSLAAHLAGEAPAAPDYGQVHDRALRQREALARQQRVRARI